MLAHTQGFGVRQTNSNSSSTADYLGKVNLFSQHKFIQRLFSPRCRPVPRDLTSLRLCFSYLENGYNYMHWSSRYSEGTVGLLYGYHCTGSPQMLILPLLPQSHLLVSVQAFRSSCQGHCSSWLVAHETDVTGPVGAKPQEQQQSCVTCCPPGRPCLSQRLRVPIWKGGWKSRAQSAPVCPQGRGGVGGSQCEKHVIA